MGCSHCYWQPAEGPPLPLLLHLPLRLLHRLLLLLRLLRQPLKRLLHQPLRLHPLLLHPQHLLLRHYDGFMKKGRVKVRGRQRYM